MRIQGEGEHGPKGGGHCSSSRVLREALRGLLEPKQCSSPHKIHMRWVIGGLLETTLLQMVGGSGGARKIN
jgi:hypothetical protein